MEVGEKEERTGDEERRGKKKVERWKEREIERGERESDRETGEMRVTDIERGMERKIHVREWERYIDYDK